MDIFKTKKIPKAHECEIANQIDEFAISQLKLLSPEFYWRSFFSACALCRVRCR